MSVSPSRRSAKWPPIFTRLIDDHAPRAESSTQDTIVPQEGTQGGKRAPEQEPEPAWVEALRANVRD